MACSYPYIENVLLKGQRRRGQVCLATTHHFWTKPIERVSRGITCLEEDQEPLKRIANTKENVTIGTANNRTTNRPDPQGGKCHWFFHKTITTKTIIVFVGIGLQTKRNELNSTRRKRGAESYKTPLYMTTMARLWGDIDYYPKKQFCNKERFYLLAHEILQYWTLTGRLATNYSDLWQIQLHVNAQLGERILQLINNRN